MNEAIALVKPKLLSVLLDGRAPLGEVKKLCSEISSTDMYRWQLEIAIKLREGKTKEALELAEAFKTDGKYPEGFDILVKCAQEHLEIDNWLLDIGLTPPPPSRGSSNHEPSTSHQVPQPIPEAERKVIGCEKDENGRTLNLPYKLRLKLKNLITNHKQYYNTEEMTRFSDVYGVSVPRLEMFFENRRKWLAKKLKAEKVNDLKRMTGKGVPQDVVDLTEDFPC